MKKSIFINLVLILAVFCIVEFTAFNQVNNDNLKFKQQADKLKANNTRNFKTNYCILKDFNTSVLRKSFYIDDKTQKSIIWFGCSFAEGAGLEDEHTPCYKISKLTGKNCINRAKGATGTQFMYYQLNNPDFKLQAPYADYVIYVFIWNHLQRLYNYQVNPLINMFNLRYKIKDDKLVEIKPFFKPFYSLYSVRRFLNRKVNNQANIEIYNFKLFNKIMRESVKKSKEYYPDSKFIMIEFPDLSKQELPDYEIKQLEKYGIKVIKVTDITKGINIYEKKYWLPDDIHPSEALWDIILPKLVKEHLKG